MDAVEPKTLISTHDHVRKETTDVECGPDGQEVRRLTRLWMWNPDYGKPIAGTPGGVARGTRVPPIRGMSREETELVYNNFLSAGGVTVPISEHQAMQIRDGMQKRVGVYLDERLQYENWKRERGLTQ